MDCQDALIEFFQYRDRLLMALRYEGLLKDEQKTDSPRVLYHYTSAEGLKGIIESGKLWATSRHHLNDSSEYRYGFEIAEDVLSEERNHNLAERVRQSLNTHLVLLNFYLTCFCDSANDLSMWRFYGLKGYSIGFNFSDLASKLKWLPPILPIDWIRSDLPPGLSLVPVIYDQNKQQDLIRNLITKAFELEVSGDLGTFTANVAYAIAQLISAFKNPAFRAEREWRLVQARPIGTDAKDAQIRVQNGTLIPYIELDAIQQPLGSGMLPLQSIHLGPAVDPVGGRRAIRLLLDQHGYHPDVRIETCSHPIRVM